MIKIEIIYSAVAMTVLRASWPLFIFFVAMSAYWPTSSANKEYLGQAEVLSPLRYIEPRLLTDVVEPGRLLNIFLGILAQHLKKRAFSILIKVISPI